MAIIQSGVSAQLWTIDPVSEAGRVTLYDIDGNAINGINTIPVNGVLSALSQTLEVELTGQAVTSVQLYGTTGTLTVSFQATINDGYSWFFVNAYSLSTDTPVSSTTGDGVWFIDVSGYHAVRLLVTSYTSGSTNAVMIAAPEERSVRSVTFLGATDNSTNSTNKMPVLAARANTSAPTWTDGNQVPLSVDTSGSLRITGTISATSAAVSTTGSAPPASATYMGASVTTAAPSYTNGTMNALSLTTSGLLRIDGSGVTQPISAASLPLPTGAATETTLGGVLTTTAFQARINTLGQKTMANSTPVVLASDQSAIPVSQSGSWTVTSNIGTTNGLALDATLSAMSLVDNAAFTDGTTRVQPVGFIFDEVAGTALTENDVAAARLDSKRAQIHVLEDGTTRGTRNTIKAASTAAVATDTALVVAISPNNTIVTSNAAVSATGASPPASATYIGGSVTTAAPSYTNATMNALSLTTAGALRIDGSAVTQPVSISGTITTQDTTSLVDNAGFTDGTSRVMPAGFIFDEAAGTALTENDIAAARLDSKRAQIHVLEDGTTRGTRNTIKAASTAAVAADTALVVAISPNNTIVTSNAAVSATGTAPPASATYIGGSVTTAAPSYTTGTMNALSLTTAGALRIDGSAVTQPISAASLPLPTGAATETTLGGVLTTTAFQARINTLGQKTMANSTPVVVASDQSAIPVIVDKSTTGTITSVAGSTSSTTILASNTSRISATVYNESNKTMYLALAATASTSSYTLQIARDSYWELPVSYTGAISAVWASGVSGNALVTEIT